MNGELYNFGCDYVLHTVGPNYNYYVGHEEHGDRYLTKAYTNTLTKGKDLGLKKIAFSLLSAGVYRGEARTIAEVIEISVRAIEVSEERSSRFGVERSESL